MKYLKIYVFFKNKQKLFEIEVKILEICSQKGFENSRLQKVVIHSILILKSSCHLFVLLVQIRLNYGILKYNFFEIGL